MEAILSQGLSSARSVDITSRVARLSYGLRMRVPFVVGKHDIRDRVWDEKSCFYRANNQMLWYIRRVSLSSLTLSASAHCCKRLLTSGPLFALIRVSIRMAQSPLLNLTDAITGPTSRQTSPDWT